MSESGRYASLVINSPNNTSTCSPVFPSYHPNEGLPTNFDSLIEKEYIVRNSTRDYSLIKGDSTERPFRWTGEDEGLYVPTVYTVNYSSINLDKFTSASRVAQEVPYAYGVDTVIDCPKIGTGTENDPERSAYLPISMCSESNDDETCFDDNNAKGFMCCVPSESGCPALGETAPGVGGVRAIRASVVMDASDSVYTDLVSCEYDLDELKSSYPAVSDFYKRWYEGRNATGESDRAMFAKNGDQLFGAVLNNYCLDIIDNGARDGNCLYDRYSKRTLNNNRECIRMYQESPLSDEEGHPNKGLYSTSVMCSTWYNVENAEGENWLPDNLKTIVTQSIEDFCESNNDLDECQGCVFRYNDPAYQLAEQVYVGMDDAGCWWAPCSSSSYPAQLSLPDQRCEIENLTLCTQIVYNPGNQGETDVEFDGLIMCQTEEGDACYSGQDCGWGTETASGIPVWAWVLIAILIVAVVGAILYFAFKSPSSPPPPSQYDYTSPTPSEPGVI